MPQAKISGTVIDQDRQPVTEAEVQVFKITTGSNENTKTKQRENIKSLPNTFTDEAAAFTTNTDKNGSYKLTVTFDASSQKIVVRAKAFTAFIDSVPTLVQDDSSNNVNLTIPVAIKVTTYRETQSGDSPPATQFTEGETVVLRADITADSCQLNDQQLKNYSYSWHVEGGSLVEQGEYRNDPEVHWDTSGLRGVYNATVEVRGGSATLSPPSAITISPRAMQRVDNVPVTMRRTATMPTEDLALWVVIRKSGEAISFDNYSHFMDMVFCGRDANPQEMRARAGYMPYSDLYAYRLLKAATEAFLMVHCGIANLKFQDTDLDTVMRRVGVGDISLDQLWTTYLKPLVNGRANDTTIPYLALIREKLSDVRLVKTWPRSPEDPPDVSEACYGLVSSKLTNPCLFELIWSYWHEEAMLVQTLHAITTRFQNVQGPADPDPLRLLEIDPLRPLNNLLWGYLQDEQFRLGVLRRAHEYAHLYGITLYGKAVPQLRPADSRSRFLEAFHNLLYLCAIFFKEDDDTTVIADGFPVLNALKEVHFVLAEGAHNQFGDMPSSARQEMLVQQWILARPEFREFLPTRTMVAYPEKWMDRVDAMKTLQGWTDVSVMHFHNLAVFGEQILLSIRFGAWSTVNEPVQASNWARYWRAEIQGYIHAYRVATGVDLTAEATDAHQAALRVTAPGILLRERLALQQAQPRPMLGSAPSAAATVLPARVRRRER
jgi:hypothetical protein